MPFKIRCGRCKNVFTGKEELAGQEGKCPQCGARLQIPAARPKPSPPATTGAASTSSADLVASGEPLHSLSEEEGDEKSPPLEKPADSACPNCHAEMPPNAVLCVKCGFHTQLGRRLETKREADLSPAEEAMARAEAALDGEEIYVPPSELPPPLPHVSGTPLLGMIVGLAAAVVAGIALFIVSRVVYIYLLYNVLLGVAIGWAVALAPKQSKYTNTPVLLMLTLLCSLLTYLAFNVALFMYVLRDINAPPAAGPVDWILGFFAFLVVRAQNERFIGGAQIGAVGNAIVWLVEIAITFFCAWGMVRMAINVCHVESVPYRVSKFVLEMLSQGNEVDTVAQELSARGWSDPRDQQHAFQAAQSLAAIIAAEASEEEGN